MGVARVFSQSAEREKWVQDLRLCVAIGGEWEKCVPEVVNRAE